MEANMVGWFEITVADMKIQGVFFNWLVPEQGVKCNNN